jgi:hypothetical protein
VTRGCEGFHEDAFCPRKAPSATPAVRSRLVWLKHKLRAYPKTGRINHKSSIAARRREGVVVVEMARTKPWTVTDEFWEKVQPLIPPAPSRAKGGRTRMDDRKAFSAMIYVLRTAASSGTPCPGRWGPPPPSTSATRSGSA